MSKQKPFTWVVAFTVSPVWVADGFTLTEGRARDMIENALPYASTWELSASVLEAPSALHIANTQGYTAKTEGAKVEIEKIKTGTPDAGKLHSALIAARDLLDSVAFVCEEGDTELPLLKIHEALTLIDARQGNLLEIE